MQVCARMQQRQWPYLNHGQRKGICAGLGHARSSDPGAQTALALPRCMLASAARHPPMVQCASAAGAALLRWESQTAAAARPSGSVGSPGAARPRAGRRGFGADREGGAQRREAVGLGAGGVGVGWAERASRGVLAGQAGGSHAGGCGSARAWRRALPGGQSGKEPVHSAACDSQRRAGRRGTRVQGRCRDEGGSVDGSEGTGWGEGDGGEGKTWREG